MKNAVGSTRRERNISQENLAKKVGISRVHLSRIESGRSIPSVEIAMRIGRELGQNVDGLFAAEEAMEGRHNGFIV